jgi:hypothetical protein
MTTKYGIRITTVNWACENGGDDRVGTFAELYDLVQQWRIVNNKEGVDEGVKYDIIPYTGENGKPPPFSKLQYENPRNSRMKR